MLKNWRINLVLIFFFLLGAALIGRLVFIQIIGYDFYKALAQGRYGFNQAFDYKRGDILTRDGKILATNIQNKYLFASPVEIKKKEETAQKLSDILNIDKEDLSEIFKKNILFSKIKPFLSSEEENKIKEMGLKGIYIGEEMIRFYPQQELASSVLGFLNAQKKGQYGIEEYYNDFLKGENYFLKEKKDGYDIVLTLDYNIQYMAEKLLNQALNDLKAEGGQIIVADPNSGEILALADLPNFNPNKYWQEKDYQVFQNSAVEKFFEPGSVFKVITMSAAIEEGKITPETTYIDKGEVKIGGWKISNYNKRIFGQQTMTQVLEHSINTGAVFAEKQLGHNLFLKYVKKFGFFEPTGIDLTGEVFSENKELKKEYEINFANASFGQGIEVTPIQLVRAFSIIANGGKPIKLHLVKKISGGDEVIKPEIRMLSESQLISQKTASQITAMLVSVVENGYAKKTKIPSYYIAGKTGTAQVSFSSMGINKKGYSDKTWQSFIGFFPAFNPRILILVKLDNPETKTAEYSAVPVFKELAEFIIDYLAIAPDY